MRRVDHQTRSPTLLGKRYAQLATRTRRRAYFHRWAGVPHALCQTPRCPHWRHYAIFLHSRRRTIGLHVPRSVHGPGFHRPRVLIPRQPVHAGSGPRP